MNFTASSREKWKQRTILILIFLSYLPFAVMLGGPPDKIDPTIFWAARQAGFAALILLMWQFVLSTRALSKFFFRDQAWVLRLHRRLGTYGIALVLAHPLLMSSAYAKSLWWPLTPDLSLDTPFSRNVALGRLALFLFLFIWVVSALLRQRVGYRPWKYMHYLVYLILPLLLLHSSRTGSSIDESAGIRYIWSGILMVYIAVVMLRLARFFTFGQRPYRLISKQEAAPGIFAYKFEPLRKPIKKPAPGQYVYVRRGLWSEEHPFSVVRIQDNGQLTITFKACGKYTRRLSRIGVGTELFLDGPYGMFTHQLTEQPTQPAVLIAGGIGITPFMQHLLGPQRQRIVFFNANREQKFMVFSGALKRALGKRLINVLSNQKVKGCEEGFVTAELVQKYLGKSFTARVYFICGPPPMMKAVTQSLVEAGVSPSQIHTEEFSF